MNTITEKNIALEIAINLEKELNVLLTEKGLTMLDKFQVRKTYNSIKEDLKNFYKSRDTLLSELGESKDGNRYTIKDEKNLKSYNDQVNKLTEQTVTIKLHFNKECLLKVENSTNYYGYIIDLLLE